MKKLAFNVFASILLIALLRDNSLGQHTPTLGNNAALQYYSAFLQMKDTEISEAGVQELGEIVAGRRNYDEAKFGTLVDNNKDAIRTMSAGAALPTCDWGINYLSSKFGWQTPVPYFWRSRVLGRLDILYALREWSNGNRADAVEAISSGMKFSRDVACGGPFVPTLIAKALLMQQLSVVNRFVDSGSLTSTQKQLLHATLNGFGADGLDWEAATNAEMDGLKRSLDQMRSAHDQRQYYKLMMGKDAPDDFQRINSADYEALEKIRSAYSDLFRHDNVANVAVVQQQLNSAPEFLRMLIPNPTRTLESKEQLKQALDETRSKLR